MQKPSLRLIIDEDTLCVFSRESVRLVFPETLNVPRICNVIRISFEEPTFRSFLGVKKFHRDICLAVKYKSAVF